MTEFLMNIHDLALSQILLSKERVLTIELGSEEDVINLLNHNPLYINGFTIPLSRENLVVDEFIGMDPNVSTFIKWINKSQSILVFSGLISELGINDFMNEGLNPSDLTVENFLFNPSLHRKYWKYHDNIYTKIIYTETHPIHKFVYNLEVQKRNLLAVVNQSVDNLFERSDIPHHKILHLNGREFYPYCYQCNSAYDRSKLYSYNQEQINDEENYKSPLCEICNIPLIIESYETLEQHNLNQLRELTERSDLVILFGDSLLIPLVTEIIPIAMSVGTKIVMISDNLTIEESAFDLVILGPYNDILSIVNEYMERKTPFKRASISNERNFTGLILGGSRI